MHLQTSAHQSEEVTILIPKVQHKLGFVCDEIKCVAGLSTRRSRTDGTNALSLFGGVDLCRRSRSLSSN